MTNPQERQAKKGYEQKVPRTPEDFEKYWKDSDAYKNLMEDIEEYEIDHPENGETLETFQKSRKAMQAKHVRQDSPYTVSIPMQIKYCTKRSYQRLWNDKTSTVTTIIGQVSILLEYAIHL